MLVRRNDVEGPSRDANQRFVLGDDDRGRGCESQRYPCCGAALRSVERPVDTKDTKDTKPLIKDTKYSERWVQGVREILSFVSSVSFVFPDFGIIKDVRIIEMVE